MKQNGFLNRVFRYGNRRERNSMTLSLGQKVRETRETCRQEAEHAAESSALPQVWERDGHLSGCLHITPKPGPAALLCFLLLRSPQSKTSRRHFPEEGTCTGRPEIVLSDSGARAFGGLCTEVHFHSSDCQASGPENPALASRLLRGAAPPGRVASPPRHSGSP